MQMKKSDPCTGMDPERNEFFNVDQFDAEKLKSFLPELRRMTVREPDGFLPRMKTIFSSCGVAFVILPSLQNAGINCAVKWVNPE